MNHYPVTKIAQCYKLDGAFDGAGTQGVCFHSHLSTQCLKYQTDQLQDVKKLEKLNNVLMRHMVAK